MKITLFLSLFLVIASLAMAQSQGFHGVYVVDAGQNGPMIVNGSDQAIYGYVVRRLTTQFSPVIPVTDSPSWISGKAIQPGERRQLGVQLTRFDNEGKELGHEIIGVLFANGTYFGPDQFLPMFVRTVANSRDFAREIRFMPDRTAVLQFHSTQGRRRARAAGASIDRQAMLSVGDRADIADQVLYLSPMEQDKALDRLAALPDVVKGDSN